MVIEMRGNQLFMILAVLKANEYYKENSVCCFELRQPMSRFGKISVFEME